MTSALKAQRRISATVLAFPLTALAGPAAMSSCCFASFLNLSQLMVSVEGQGNGGWERGVFKELKDMAEEKSRLL